GVRPYRTPISPRRSRLPPSRLPRPPGLARRVANASGRAQRHAEEEAQRARHLVDMRPRPAEPCQVKLIGANLLDAQPIRRAVEEPAELGTRVNVGLLGCWREVANRHVS